MANVAIVGMAPMSRYLAPLKDESWEIWALSPMQGEVISDLPRITRWYELHDLDDKEAEVPGYIDWLNKLECEIVLRQIDERVPKARAYNLDAAIELAGCRYFNNSVSYMIADAISHVAERIDLFGVDMAHMTEYSDQRPSCEYMCGVAVGHGIKVHVPKESDLLKVRYLYGFEEPGDFEAKLLARQTELEARSRQAEQEERGAHETVVATAAACGELRAVQQLLNGQLTDELTAAFDEREKAMIEGIERAKRERVKLHEDKVMFTGCLEQLRWEREWI